MKKVNWKELGYKTVKGAFSGVVAIGGGLFAAGFPVDKQSWLMVLGAIASAAIHGGANAVKQYMDGATLNKV
jgi:hypothetical protein